MLKNVNYQMVVVNSSQFFCVSSIGLPPQFALFGYVSFLQIALFTNFHRIPSNFVECVSSELLFQRIRHLTRFVHMRTNFCVLISPIARRYAVQKRNFTASISAGG